MFSLFLDESGIDSFKDPQQYYVVAGVIFDREYCRSNVMPQVNKLKNKYFGSADVVFHFTEMKNKRNEFNCLNNKANRISFWDGYFNLLESLDFTIVSAVVDKKEMQARYYYPQAVKRVALPLIYENYIHFLKESASLGKVFVEQVNPKEDERVQVQYHSLMANGTARLSREGFIKHIAGVRFHLKSDNIIGLQIADTIAFGINAYKDNRIKGSAPDLSRLWAIIDKKLYDGRLNQKERYGLQNLP